MASADTRTVQPGGQTATPDPARLLRRFLDAARGSRRPLVHLQHNPDPDAQQNQDRKVPLKPAHAAPGSADAGFG